jgi:tetratricopeptide (TPR) repeat protein
MNILLGIFLVLSLLIIFAIWLVYRRTFARKEENNTGEPRVYYYEGRSVFHKLYERAITELENGNRTTGKELLEQFIKLEPSNPKGYIGLGLYYHEEDIIEAEKQFQHAYNLDPQLVLPLVWLGIIAYQRMQFQIAIDYFEKAIALKRNIPEPYLGLARCYDELNNAAKALHYFERFLELAPTAREATEVHQRMAELSHNVPSDA